MTVKPRALARAIISSVWAVEPSVAARELHRHMGSFEIVFLRSLVMLATNLRDEDIDASPASVIESVRLADSLAAIRGRTAAVLEDLGEATLSVLCHGNPMPMRLIHRKLVVGQRLGRVPDAVPMVPLQRDLAALQLAHEAYDPLQDPFRDGDRRSHRLFARVRTAEQVVRADRKDDRVRFGDDVARPFLLQPGQHVTGLSTVHAEIRCRNTGKRDFETAGDPLTRLVARAEGKRIAEEHDGAGDLRLRSC